MRSFFSHPFPNRLRKAGIELTLTMAHFPVPIRYAIAALCCMLCAATATHSLAQERPDAGRSALADSVKQEFIHAWDGYKRYAWGHDALKPLTKQPHDWYGQSLLLTPVDALDAMLIMGLETQAREAKQLILDSLRFD